MFEKLKSLFKFKKKAKQENVVIPQPIQKCEIKEKKVAEKKQTKCQCDGSQEGVAFFIRMQKRRAKKIMCQNMNRRRRGLFQYV